MALEPSDSSESLNIDLSDIDFEQIDREVKEFAEQTYGEYTSFHHALVEDLRDAAQVVKLTGTQFAKRTYLRTFFSFVEGVLFARQTVILRYVEFTPQSVPQRFDVAEQILLREVEYELDDNGSVKIKEGRYPAFLRRVRFIFSMWAKHYGKACTVDYSGTGWEAFREVQAIRNRITHPRRESHLMISDIEMFKIKGALEWFLKALD
jgi:hypothetical protein